MPDENHQGGYFSGIRGFLTALAALITAVGGLAGTLHQMGVLGRPSVPLADTAAVVYERDSSTGGDGTVLDAPIAERSDSDDIPRVRENPPSVESSPPNQAYGFLDLEVAPSGFVSVDGQDAESATPVRVSEGTHRIRFSHPQYGTKDTVISVQAGRSHEVAYHFEHSVQVLSSNDAGTIYMNGRRTDRSPPHTQVQGPGTYRIALETANPQRAHVVGGVYAREANGREIKRREFSGNEVAITLEPSFEFETHEVSFRVDELDPLEQARREVAELETELEHAIEEQDWVRLPGPLANFYPERLTPLYAKHRIRGANVVVGNELGDGDEVTFPVTVYVEYQQRGRDGIQHVPLPAHWTWGLTPRGMELLRVRAE